jgi:hypothetical protein
MSSLLNASMIPICGGYARHWPDVWLDSALSLNSFAAHSDRRIGGTARSGDRPASTADSTARGSRAARGSYVDLLRVVIGIVGGLECAP